MNIHIPKINLASTKVREARFWVPNYKFIFDFSVCPAKISNVQQSGISKGFLCLRRADTLARLGSVYMNFAAFGVLWKCKRPPESCNLYIFLKCPARVKFETFLIKLRATPCPILGRFGYNLAQLVPNLAPTLSHLGPNCVNFRKNVNILKTRDI